MPKAPEHKKTPFHDSKWLKSVKKIYNLEKISIKEKKSEITFFLIEKEELTWKNGIILVGFYFLFLIVESIL